ETLASFGSRTDAVFLLATPASCTFDSLLTMAEGTTPAAPDPKPSDTRGPGTPVDPPTQPEQPPAESEDPPAEPETPPGDGGGTVPQARSATTAPPAVHTLARTAPPEENQAA
ncbi:hypothetical protein ACWEP3_16240, partial [Streptomyces albidoflavus]